MMVNKKHENKIGRTKPTIRQCVFAKETCIIVLISQNITHLMSQSTQ